MPALADRVSSLEAVAVTLQTAVTTLATQVSILKTANTDLQSALNAESAARIAAETALQKALDAERAARIATDTTLQNALTAEAGARIAAETALQNAIDNCSSRPTLAFSDGLGYQEQSVFYKVISKTLPQGNWVFIATAWVEAGGQENVAPGDSFCQLRDSSGHVRGEGDSTGISQTMTLNGRATIPAGGSEISLWCAARGEPALFLYEGPDARHAGRVVLLEVTGLPRRQKGLAWP